MKPRSLTVYFTNHDGLKYEVEVDPNSNISIETINDGSSYPLIDIKIQGPAVITLCPPSECIELKFIDVRRSDLSYR